MFKKYRFRFFLPLLILILVLGFFSFKLLISHFRQSQPVAPTPIVKANQNQITTQPTQGQSTNSASATTSSPNPPETQVTNLKEEATFDINVLEPNVGAISSIQFVLSKQKVTSHFVKSVEINIPPGWEFTKGDLLNDKEIVGKGVFNLMSSGQQILTTILNDRNTLGHKSHWIINFGSSESSETGFDGFVDGDKDSGHKIILSRDIVQNAQPPSKLELTIFANSASEGGSNNLVFSGPSKPGNCNFSGIIRHFDGTSTTFQKNISIN
jgi:hypothetical protein